MHAIRRSVARKLPLIWRQSRTLSSSAATSTSIAPAALAALYEELGGEVVYFGKPHRPIYEVARHRLAEIAAAPVADARILAVGDGPMTDIMGANDAGIDALFITGGIACTARCQAFARSAGGSTCVRRAGAGGRDGDRRHAAPCLVMHKRLAIPCT